MSQPIELQMILTQYYVGPGTKQILRKATLLDESPIRSVETWRELSVEPVQSIELTLVNTGKPKDMTADELKEALEQLFASGERLKVVISKAGDDE
jgi:hypothetical protein